MKFGNTCIKNSYSESQYYVVKGVSHFGCSKQSNRRPPPQGPPPPAVLCFNSLLRCWGCPQQRNFSNHRYQYSWVYTQSSKIFFVLNSTEYILSQFFFKDTSGFMKFTVYAKWNVHIWPRRHQLSMVLSLNSLLKCWGHPQLRKFSNHRHQHSWVYTQ